MNLTLCGSCDVVSSIEVPFEVSIMKNNVKGSNPKSESGRVG